MILNELFESPQLCPECGGISFSDLILAEKKDACYYKVKASAKVWPSAYASGRLVQCRKKGAANYGKSKTESMAEANDPNFVGFMNKTLGDRVDAKPEQPKTGHDWYDNAATHDMNTMPSYKHAFKFGMSVLQSMDAETKQHFAQADNDELFSYLMKLARKKKFSPKYFVEEDLWEVTGLFSEIFHDPSMQEWEWADLLRSTLKNQGMAESKPREKEADYGADYQDMVARVKHLAGLGPLKTVWDPQKRVYRNVPVAVQPKK